MTATTTARPASPELVRQLVREVRDQVGDRTRDEPLVIGVRASPRWDHGTVDDPIAGRIDVAGCPTPLAARRALADFSADTQDPARTLVVLTNLADAELGADLLGRFVRPRLLQLNVWNAVRQRFDVRRLDPAFDDPRFSWMAETLLDIPAEAIPHGVSVLGVDTALRAISAAVLGAGGITLERLLIASAQLGFATRVDQADPRTVERLCETLADLLGPAAELVTGTIGKGRGERALPAGLAARAIAGASSGSFAQAKVADLTGVELPTDDALRAWARAAEVAFGELEAARNPVADQIAFVGSALVTEWQAPRPEASDVLAAGFEARLDLLAQELEARLDDEVVDDVDELRAAVRHVVEHREAGLGSGRARAHRAQLAARLVSWLRDPVSDQYGTGTGGPSGGSGVGSTSGPLTLGDTVSAYQADGAWVDAARRRVGEGDDTPPRFAAVMRRIGEAAHEKRAEGNRGFAEALARWTTDGTAGALDNSGLVAVESVLDRLVAPVAAQQPVLLLVLDGCGIAPFLEFAGQFRQFGLREISRDGSRQLALAALPTVTEVSRTSLLTGTLATGAAADESRDLPTHPSIAKLGGPPAVVFHHRPDLVSGVGQGLPAHVVQAVGESGPRVVAAVVNTIDDELSRGTFTSEYRIEDMGPLAALLRAASDAGRVIVVTADHGHVLGVGLDGRGDVERSGDGGDRWRIADRTPRDDEVLLRGPRVLLGDERGVLAPWNDDLRYSAKHGGYHGGATPDECLVPLSVFLPTGVAAPAGWTEVSVATPAWWDLHIASAVDAVAEPTAPAAGSRRTKKAAQAGEGQGALFVPPTEPASTPSAPLSAAPVVATGAGGATAPWADALIASEIYQVQHGAIGRAKPPEEHVRSVLGALHARGGVASFAVIALAADMPAGRVPGLMAILSRLLNVDGFAVLTVDASAQEARLDEALLRTQFLDGAAS